MNMATYSFGKTSEARLQNLNSTMRSVCTVALRLSEHDFSIIETLRDAETQNKYFKEGYSKLDGYKRKSWHQAKDDGTAHAVDVCIWRDGKLRWEMGHVLVPVFAEAAQRVYHKCGTHFNIRTGYGWQFLLREGKALTEEEIAVGFEKYVLRKEAEGRKVFVDAPHFEIHFIT